MDLLHCKLAVQVVKNELIKTLSFFVKKLNQAMEELSHYEGQVKNGRFHGKGKYTDPKGNAIEGTFENGRPEGEATVSLPTGDVYQMIFKDGKIVKKTAIKGREFKNKIRSVFNPFRPPDSEPTVPKSSLFLFPGTDFNENG